MGLVIEVRLGRGRTLETFAARLDEGPVVVKRPRAELLGCAPFLNAFRAWGAGLAGVEHANLAAVLGVEETADGPVVLQQRVEGASLAWVQKALSKRRRSFQPAMALTIVRDLAKALHHLHAAGVSHGGLDPQEIILGYDGRAWVTDAGLRALDASAGPLLEPSPELRTYQPPEGGTASPAGDVHAAGLLLLEMLLGQPLWIREKMDVPTALAALKDFTNLGQAQPLLSERLSQLLGGCLSPLPGERITAEVLIAAAEHVLQDQKLSMDPTALGELVRAAVPPPEAADAPTMMIDPVQAEALARAHSLRMELMEGASLAVDPELEQKALTRMGRPPSGPAAPLPMAILSAARPPSRHPSSGPKAVPDVAKVAAAAQAKLIKWPKREILLGLAGSLVVVVVALLWSWRGQAAPTHLILGSNPQGAAVYADDALIGATPLERDLELKKGLVKLRFELDGYETHSISIGTEEGELRYEAQLKSAPPSP